MTIQTALHYAGTREMIQRLKSLLEDSRSKMRPSDYKPFEADMRARIAELEEAGEHWLRAENIRIMERSWFKIVSSPHGVLRPEGAEPPPIRSAINAVQRQKPAATAGFSLPLMRLAFCRNLLIGVAERKRNTATRYISCYKLFSMFGDMPATC